MWLNGTGLYGAFAYPREYQILYAGRISIIAKTLIPQGAVNPS
jgi:hypothetical protein